MPFRVEARALARRSVGEGAHRYTWALATMLLVPVPRVSVILPVRDREGCVARAIRSVLAQEFRDFELIVVDDGSTDGTCRVVESFGEAVTLLGQPARGVYAARNLGVRHANGELIAFIDSDDAWRAGKLALQVPLMDRPEVGLVFGDTAHVGTDYAPTGRTSFRVAPPSRGRVAEAFVRCNFIPTVTVLVRRRCLDEIGGFSEAQPLSADLLAWFRIAQRHELDYVEQAVADYTVHEGGISFDHGRAVAARIALFRDELAQTSDSATRAIIRRLLFNLALSLAAAAVRGRARNTPGAFRLARRTLRENGGPAAACWTAVWIVQRLRASGRISFA
jgi:glycosyltransferase involved in cell wall biosynthesis